MTSSNQLNSRLRNTANCRSLLHLCLLLLSLSLVSVASVSAESATTASSNPEWLNQKMDLDCNGRPLVAVLEEVAEFFDTTLIYQAEGDELPVRCSYSQATVSELLRLLFKRQNRAILIEESPERRITVQVFGVSEYNVVSSDGNSEKKTLPFLSEMTNKELAAMQNAQLKLYQQKIQDPNVIISGLDITRAEVQSLHREQSRKYRKLLGDKNQIVTGMSITRQQLENLHEHQLKIYEEERQGLDVVDPLTGLTSMEIKELHQQQIKRLKLE